MKALALFVAGWTLLVMQPCTAALEQVEHDCPHCPVEVEPPCVDGLLDCGTPDGVPAAENSSAKPPVAALYASTEPTSRRVAPVSSPPPHARPDPTGPPLTEAFCCHLE